MMRDPGPGHWHDVTDRDAPDAAGAPSNKGQGLVGGRDGVGGTERGSRGEPVNWIMDDGQTWRRHRRPLRSCIGMSSCPGRHVRVEACGSMDILAHAFLNSDSGLVPVLMGRWKCLRALPLAVGGWGLSLSGKQQLYLPGVPELSLSVCSDCPCLEYPN